jgi:hypothetical protein
MKLKAMSNIGSYEERLKNFTWSLASNELDYKDGQVINIGWYVRQDLPSRQSR